MKVRLLTFRAGLGFTQRPGDVIDVCDREATTLINTGQAEPVGERVIETAMEEASRPRNKPQRRGQKKQTATAR